MGVGLWDGGVRRQVVTNLSLLLIVSSKYHVINSYLYYFMVSFTCRVAICSQLYGLVVQYKSGIIIRKLVLPVFQLQNGPSNLKPLTRKP